MGALIAIALLLFTAAVPVHASEADKAERGREVYLENGCAVCHGKDADGKGVAAAYAGYAPIDLHQVSLYKKGIDEKSLEYTIINGVEEEEISRMPAFKDIDAIDLEALISYIRSLHQKPNSIQGEDHVAL